MIAGDVLTVSIPQGSVLTVTPTNGGVATVTPIDTPASPGTPVPVSSTASLFGPFNSPRSYRIAVTAGTITYAIAIPDPLTFANLLNTDVALGNGAKILTGAGVPVDGTSGTGANVAAKGSLYLDVTNGKAYINGNTLASPTWKIITSA